MIDAASVLHTVTDIYNNNESNIFQLPAQYTTGKYLDEFGLTGVFCSILQDDTTTRIQYFRLGGVSYYVYPWLKRPNAVVKWHKSGILQFRIGSSHREDETAYDFETTITSYDVYHNNFFDDGGIGIDFDEFAELLFTDNGNGVECTFHYKEYFLGKKKYTPNEKLFDCTKYGCYYGLSDACEVVEMITRFYNSQLQQYYDTQDCSTPLFK
jgi:hypothetical protein